MIAERRDLAERYSSAIESSHLEVTLEMGDVDLLVAAGWTKESLGTALYRVMVEFDTVRGGHRLATQALREAQRQARKLCATGVPELVAHAREYLRQAEAAALTEKALMLIEMKTLPQARRALGAFAIQHATRTRYMRDDSDVLVVSGRALQAFLDPLCGACGGRGFNGGMGDPVLLCHDCHGSGRRTAWLGHDNASHRFGRSLLCQMDLKVSHVARKMRRFLRREVA